MPSPVTKTMVPVYLNNATNFRAYAFAFSDMLDQAGLPRVNPSSPVAGWVESAAGWNSVVPGAVGFTETAFEVRKFADPSTGASPVYIRFSIGVGSNTNYVRVTVRVGTSVDLATGTIRIATPSDPTAAEANNIAVADVSDSNLRTSYATYDGNGLVIAHSWDGGGGAFLLVIDRQRTITGAAVPNDGWPNTGFMRLVGSSFLTVDPVTGQAVANAKYPIITGRYIPVGMSMRSVDETRTLFPCFNPGRQGLYGCKMILGMATLDLPLGTIFEAEHLGAVRTYRSLGAQFTGADQTASPGAGVAIWWHD